MGLNAIHCLSISMLIMLHQHRKVFLEEHLKHQMHIDIIKCVEYLQIFYHNHSELIFKYNLNKNQANIIEAFNSTSIYNKQGGKPPWCSG